MTDCAADLSPRLSAAFKNACLAELEALKPGNVHVFADGHGMVVQDFIRSAEAASREIAKPDLAVGRRIQGAIEATWNAVGCNTNLGIVLLCAPMIEAAFRSTGDGFQERLAHVIQSLTVDDATRTYEAILRAAPAGLGFSEKHDVHRPAVTTLLEAMSEAAPRDRVAYQYAHRYPDVRKGTEVFRQARRRWGWAGWATTAVYLEFLATFPDSHICRKFGEAAADRVRVAAAHHRDQLFLLENPKKYQRPLLDFDRDLKARGLNPGTSADLTVASLLMVELEKMG